MDMEKEVASPVIYAEDKRPISVRSEKQIARSVEKSSKIEIANVIQSFGLNVLRGTEYINTVF